MVATEPPTRTAKPKNRAQRRAAMGKGRRYGLDANAAHRLKMRLRGHDGDFSTLEPGVKTPSVTREGVRLTFAPSEPWVEVMTPVIEDTTADGKRVSAYWHQPAGSLSEPVPDGWRRCPCCGHNAPPQMFGSSGACDDCRYGAMKPAELAKLPGSTSSMSMRKIRQARARGEQPTGGM